MILVAVANLVALGVNTAVYADKHQSWNLALAVVTGVIALASLTAVYNKL